MRHGADTRARQCAQAVKVQQQAQQRQLRGVLAAWAAHVRHTRSVRSCGVQLTCGLLLHLLLWLPRASVLRCRICQTSCSCSTCSKCSSVRTVSHSPVLQAAAAP